MTFELPHPPIPENAKLYADKVITLVKDIENLDLDYSPESLVIIDNILDKFHHDKVSAEEIGATVFAFGCYVGEVFIRNVGGQWLKEEESEMKGLGGFFIVLALPGNKTVNPIGKVFKRVRDGETENLPYFYYVFTKT